LAAVKSKRAIRSIRCCITSIAANMQTIDRLISAERSRSLLVS
jgi:hypothetical protein